MEVDVRDIELATIRAWRAEERIERNGWLYLASGGATGRVNAVWPLDWAGNDLDAAIDDAEAWYAERKLPPCFKLTDSMYAPAGLAEALSRRGYEASSPELIMSMAIKPQDVPDNVQLSASIPPAFDEVIRVTSRDLREYHERLGIARRAPQPAAFATLAHDGRTVAIGMAAAGDGLAGIFLMRTVAEARRNGHARQILGALLAQSTRWGSQTAFLQVNQSNAPAIALYSEEGFRPVTAYRFWRKH